jgi:methyl-accepting chemotaxis protein
VRYRQLKSVGFKLFVLIFCSIIACVVTVGLVAYSKSKDILEDKVSEASLQTVTQLANNLDVTFRSYEDLTMQLMVDKDFHEQIRKLVSRDPQLNRSEAIGKLTDRMKSYVTGNVSISGVLLIPVDENLSVLNVGYAKADRAEVLKETPWFQHVVDNDGKPMWIPPQPDGIAAIPAQKSIGLSRLIKDPMTNRPYYVMVMEIHLSSINKRFADIKLGEGSEIAIVDAGGRYVSAPDDANLGKSGTVSLPSEGEDGKKGALKLTTVQGKDVLAVYNALTRMEWRLLATIPVQELVKDAKAIQILTWIMVGAATLLALAIGALVLSNIARPLMKLRNLMLEGADGNLAVRANMEKREDEIGELAESFDRMMRQIADLAMRTTRSAEEVYATASSLTEASRITARSAKEVAAATDEIAYGANSLAVEAERGTDLALHIGQQMKLVMHANQEMVQSAEEVERDSERGTDSMGVLMKKTATTEEMTRAMVEKVNALNASTGSIVSILDVLHSLTKQTNILSLNATIEAARAGAAGKGFMVVADEIRKLADQSRQSIDVVSQITEKLRQEIDETVLVLSEAYPLFQQQISSVKDANAIFLSVQSHMEKFAQRLALVTDSVSQLDQSQTVVVEAMTNVSAVAEESSSTSEEVASLSAEQLQISDNMVELSERLDAVSRKLKESLSTFRMM